MPHALTALPALRVLAKAGDSLSVDAVILEFEG